MKGGKKATNVFFFFPTRTKCISRPAAGNKKTTSFLLSKRLACTKCKVPKDKQNSLTIRSRLVWCVVATKQKIQGRTQYCPTPHIFLYSGIHFNCGSFKSTKRYLRGTDVFKISFKGRVGERSSYQKKSSRSVPLNFKLI